MLEQTQEDMGGLIGALLSMMASIHSPKPPRYVSRMYSACIPHTSADTCIVILYLDVSLCILMKSPGYMYLDELMCLDMYPV